MMIMFDQWATSVSLLLISRLYEVTIYLIELKLPTVTNHIQISYGDI